MPSADAPAPQAAGGVLFALFVLFVLFVLFLIGATLHLRTLRAKGA